MQCRNLLECEFWAWLGHCASLGAFGGQSFFFLRASTRFFLLALELKWLDLIPLEIGWMALCMDAPSWLPTPPAPPFNKNRHWTAQNPCFDFQKRDKFDCASLEKLMSDTNWLSMCRSGRGTHNSGDGWPTALSLSGILQCQFMTNYVSRSRSLPLRFSCCYLSYRKEAGNGKQNDNYEWWLIKETSFLIISNRDGCSVQNNSPAS